jgi:hypothetical protein
VWLSGLSGGKSPHNKRPHPLKTVRLTVKNVSRFCYAKIGGKTMSLSALQGDLTAGLAYEKAHACRPE